MEHYTNYGRERNLNDLAPSSSPIQDLGLSANPRIDMGSIHPRHPRASFYRPDVTQGMALERDHPSNSFGPPWPHGPTDSARPWAPPNAHDDINEGGALSAGRPTLEPNWPLTQSPMEYTWDTAPFRPLPAPPQRLPQLPQPRPPQQVAPQPHHAPLTAEQSNSIVQFPSHVRMPDQIYESGSYAYQNTSQMTPSDYTPQKRDESPKTPTSTHQVRRISSLGPPSSRRGHSMLYSTPSFVAPIVEEKLSIGTRSSYASSAAIPDGRLYAIGQPVRRAAQNDEASMNGQDGGWMIDQYGEERSMASDSWYKDAPLPAVPISQSHFGQRHGDQSLPSAVDPFNGGSVFMDLSSDSSNTSITQNHTPETSPGTEKNLPSPPHMMSRSLSPPNLAELSGSPQPFSRLHSMKRPPRLDIDSVRRAESRGSLTSLPDLILRATKLADMIDKGKRPSSRLDDLDFFNERGSMVVDNHRFDMLERRKSGLSDMLASFPPPVHTPQSGPRRDSLLWTGSWPVLPGVEEQDETADDGSDDSMIEKKQARRCCGCPAWVFFLIPLLVLCLIIVIVLPLELGRKHGSDMTLGECQKSLTCLHGGTNVVFDNTCSCICTNGFTGSTCSVGGSIGCITTNLVATDGSSRINNVTLGRAIPRVIADSSGNFSLPLSATALLAKFNAANLSCIAQNTLVTFDGQYTRAGEARALGATKITAKLTLPGAIDESESSLAASSLAMDTRTKGYVLSLVSRSSQTPSGSGSSSASPADPAPTSAFVVTENILDFARTVVLYVLQTEDIDSASSAQGLLQQFFKQASPSQSRQDNTVTIEDASNLSIGGNNTVDLVSIDVNLGQGSVVHQRNVKHVVTVSVGGNGSQDVDDELESS